MDNPPPVFFLLLFPAMALSAGIVIRSIGSAVARVRAARTPPPLPVPPPVALPPADVARMQAELDELRTQVERLHAAEAFYAQLHAPASAASTPRAETQA